MRVSSNTVSDQIVAQIQTLGAKQAKLQNQVATGQKIFQASDDPSAMGRVLNLETEQRQIAQYSRNASRALGLSQASYSGLQAIKKVSDRATQIGTLGASINSASAAGAYATEVDQLIEQTLQSANGRFGNDYLYAGTAVDSPPFTATRDANGKVTAVAYAGNTASASIAVSETSSLTPATSGDTNLGLRDFLNHLVSLRDALNSNSPTDVTTAQNGLITTEDQIVSAISENGGVQTRIEAAQSQQTDRATTLDSLVSGEVDADLPLTITKLTQTSTAYQAALQSAANIMKLSLLDYIH